MSVATMPERSSAQRMDALARANEIRLARAQLKREIRAGVQDVAAILVEPPPHLHTMRVADLLIARPKHGRVKVNKQLNFCRIAPSKTLAGLSERQRLALVDVLNGVTTMGHVRVVREVEPRTPVVRQPVYGPTRKRRATWLCRSCDVVLSEPTLHGLCGFCESEGLFV